MEEKSLSIRLATVASSLMIVCVYASARVVTVNDARISYDNYLSPQCVLLVRHAINDSHAGWDSMSDLCDKYRNAKDDDVIQMAPSEPEHSAIPVKKKDYISLDDLPPWVGDAPIRAYYSISRKQEEADPDVAPSYLPYDNWNKISNYIVVDRDGYEVAVVGGKRTGYRFYDYLGVCYLATEYKPRKYKYRTECQGKRWDYNDFPKSVDVTSHPWVNITEQNTVNLGERMPADGVEIRGSMAVKPLIYSDYPIGDNGRVTKGRAMCMADCAPGMLMKLLHAGQSIWGPPRKPSAK
ncbi:hypothetical protein C7401_11069 [Paraburkholderia unamae]|uniref:hypothetical protein n=1 Tax=Paraburkholderia unamae TaxID=219649 RepID=UPI000DC34A1D|nr:hypothetical protein [Paraburkholderia unamae]RAR59940.1 hypothetical protein C7401_11069 [Paraburkholderia unamae]